MAVILTDTEPGLPLADLQPWRFVVIANSTEEYVTGWNVFRGNQLDKKWERRATIRDVYRDIADPNNAARFTVSYEKLNRYVFVKHRIDCVLANLHN